MSASDSDPTHARRIAWRCSEHFKGKEVLTIGGRRPCEVCGTMCGMGSRADGAEWTTDTKPTAGEPQVVPR